MTVTSHEDVKDVIVVESTAESGLQLDNLTDVIPLYDMRKSPFCYSKCSKLDGRTSVSVSRPNLFAFIIGYFIFIYHHYHHRVR
jgi:hypothetical protein